MSVPKVVSSACGKGGMLLYVSLAILMSIGFGYSLAATQGARALIALSEQQVKERASLNRAHKAEKKYLREQLFERNKTIARQSDQLATNGGKAADGTKAAIQLIEKQTPEAKAQ